MIPLRDNIPSRRIPFVNYTILAINVAVFIFQLTLSGRSLNIFLAHYALTPRVAMAYFTHGQYVAAIVPFFTSMFLHAGFLHIGFNMLFLFVFGDNVEDRYGHFLFLVFYFAAGLAGAVGHFGFSLLTGSSINVQMLGASGAISGVLGAYLITYPRAYVTTFIIFIPPLIIEVPAMIFLGFWIILQIFGGAFDFFSAVSGHGGGVAYWAHIGGFAWGALFALFFKHHDRSRPGFIVIR